MFRALCFLLLACLARAATYTVANTDLHYNLYDGTGNPIQSEGATLKFTVTGTSSITVSGSTGVYSIIASDAHLGYVKNGAVQTSLAFTADGTQNFVISGLSNGDTIQIIGGIQSKPSSTVYGSFVTAIDYGAGSITIIPPSKQNVIICMVDSIGSGDSATPPETNGVLYKLRQDYGYNIIMDGWGYGTFFEFTSDGTKRTATIARHVAAQPALIITMLGTNDFGFNSWSAASMQTGLTTWIAAERAALPNIRMYCVTPLQRTGEDTPNGSGSTLPNYRTAMTAAFNAYPDFTLVYDGSNQNIVSTANIPGGLHPNTTGHAQYEAWMQANPMQAFLTFMARRSTAVGTANLMMSAR